MKKLILSIGILISVTSFAQNRVQSEIIMKPRRPHVADYINNPQALEKFVGDYYDDRYGWITSDSQNRASQINEGLPNFIVHLEKAFPGGTYAFLGRDMDLIADAVDAYYLKKGQSGRVVRIEFSTPSLQNSTPELITEFLTQLGLDSTGRYSRGTFVIVDFTSYSNKGRNDYSFPSQARYIYQSVASQMKANGLNSAQIVSRISIATLDGDARKNANLYDSFIDDRDEFLRYQALGLDLGAEQIFPRIAYIPEASKMPYYSEWNDKYGPIRRNSSGLLITEPQSTFLYDVRKSVFAQIVKTLNYVLSDEMDRRITTIAKRNGVDFTPKKISVVVDHDANLKNELKYLNWRLSPLGENREYEIRNAAGVKLRLTENGAKVLEFLVKPELVLAKNYFEIVLRELIAMQKQDLIGVRDFRKIFAHTLTLKAFENDEIVRMAQERYLNFEPLEIMMGREAEREKYSNVPGVGGENYRKLIQNGRLQMSCKFIL